MTRSTRRLSATVVAIAIAMMVVLGAFTGTAAAVTETRTVPAEIIFINGARADDPGNCAALVFLRWADVPGTVSATGKYNFNGKATSTVSAPPHDDNGSFVIPYAVAPGFHWMMISKNWSDGPGANDCSVGRARLETLITGPATVDLRLDVPKAKSKACRTAKAAAALTRAKIILARKALENATTKAAKDRARAALSRAKARHAAAVTRIKSSC